MLTIVLGRLLSWRMKDWYFEIIVNTCRRDLFHQSMTSVPGRCKCGSALIGGR